jgi:hypothetical protein
MDRQPNTHDGPRSIYIQDGHKFERRVLARAAEYKNCDVHFDEIPRPSKTITLATREVPIEGFLPSLLFLEERYLDNSFLHHEPINRAVQLSIAHKLTHEALVVETFEDLINSADPWILGKKVSLLDLLAEASHYARRLARLFTPWEC